MIKRCANRPVCQAPVPPHAKYCSRDCSITKQFPDEYPDATPRMRTGRPRRIDYDLVYELLAKGLPHDAIAKRAGTEHRYIREIERKRQAAAVDAAWERKKP
jgi:hypothetical protein